jgi:transcriptional regulator with XRE-family HTH domain
LVEAEQPSYLTPLQRFGVEVRAVRRGRKITQKSLATYSGYTEAYVSRIETGTLKPSEEFAQKCDTVFQTHGMFVRLRDDIEKANHPSFFAPYAELERDAVSILDYSPSLIMGVLQTPEYAEAVFRSAYPRENADWIRSKVAARLQRREVMQRKNPPLLWVVIHEGCLHSHIGNPKIMHDQIAYLLSEAESPHVTVQLLPFNAGAPTVTESFTVLTFAKKPDIVYMDTAFTGQVLDSVTIVAKAKESYDRLRAAALHPEESLAVIRRIKKEFEQ